MTPFIQRVTSVSSPFSRGSAARSVGPGEQRAHDLDRHRGDVVVGDRRLRPPRRSRRRSARSPPSIPSTGPLAVAARRRATRRCATHGSIHDVAGRAVEHAVGAAAGAREVEQQLQQDQPAGARAHLARPGRHQRAREPVGEELAERGRARVGVHVVPPALELPLPVAGARRSSSAASAAGRRTTPSSCGGMPSAGRRLEHEARERPRSRRATPAACAGATSSLLAAGLGEQHPLGARRGGRRPTPRDPPHRVGHVAVEAREEAEAVLGREVAAAVDAEPGTGRLRALPPESARALVDRDREAALGQLVSGGQTRHAAAEHRHPLVIAAPA